MDNTKTTEEKTEDVNATLTFDGTQEEIDAALSKGWVVINDIRWCNEANLLKLTQDYIDKLVAEGKLIDPASRSQEAKEEREKCEHEIALYGHLLGGFVFQNEKGDWLFCCTDEDGKNQHSEVFASWTIACEAFRQHCYGQMYNNALKWYRIGLEESGYITEDADTHFEKKYSSQFPTQA